MGKDLGLFKTLQNNVNICIMANRFFNPYVGKYYHMGFYNGKKVLVLGASHYCTYNSDSDKYNCPVWDLCTSMEKKDSSAFNETCSYYKEYSIDAKLEDSASLELDNFLNGDNYPTYQNFTTALMDGFKITDKQSVWNRLAFVNYVQYFLPSMKTPTQTRQDVRNFDALLETIDELSPDIVVVWGVKVTNQFHKKYIRDKVQILDVQKNNYFWKLEVWNHKLIIVNPYHPSDVFGNWTRQVEQFVKEFKVALDTSYANI